MDIEILGACREGGNHSGTAGSRTLRLHAPLKPEPLSDPTCVANPSRITTVFFYLTLTHCGESSVDTNLQGFS